MAQILIVEDDKSINKLIRKNLELVGHTCACIFNGDEVLPTVEKHTPDLILLDVMLPKLSGFEVMEEIREQVPVIFITAKSAIPDRVKGLRLGADDYITKPFDMSELLARVDSVLRRTHREDKSFVLGNVRVDFTSREAYKSGVLIDFTPQEFTLIEALIKNRNIALSRDKLLEKAWGYDYGGDTRTVDVHIHGIRKKLGWEDVVKTVFKIGYRLEVKG